MTTRIQRQVDDYGRVIFRGDDAIELLLRGHDLPSLLIKTSDEIRRYNDLCVSRDKADYQIRAVSDDGDPLGPRIDTWFVPKKYGCLDVRQELLAHCQRQDEIERVGMEMDLFETRGLLPVLQLMVYLVDLFREHGIVWGVGRGSSVASYCLFLIGVHHIDAIHYGLDIREFLK